MKFTKNKVFLMLVAGALVLGIAGGTILAATASTANAQENGAGQGQSFAARVAEKLTAALGLEQDITEAQVQEAFDGARADQQVDLLQRRLDKLEEGEKVTAEESAAIMDWFQAYPYTDLVKLRYIGLASSEKVEGVLERLVEKDRITQAQSDGIQSWYDDRPELPEGLERSGRHGRDGRGGHHGGRHQDKDGSENDDNGDGDGGETGTRFNGRRFHRGGPGRGNSM